MLFCFHAADSKRTKRHHKSLKPKETKEQKDNKTASCQQKPGLKFLTPISRPCTKLISYTHSQAWLSGRCVAESVTFTVGERWHHDQRNQINSKRLVRLLAMKVWPVGWPLLAMKVRPGMRALLAMKARPGGGGC